MKSSVQNQYIKSNGMWSTRILKNEDEYKYIVILIILNKPDPIKIYTTTMFVVWLGQDVRLMKYVVYYSMMLYVVLCTYKNLLYPITVIKYTPILKVHTLIIVSTYYHWDLLRVYIKGIHSTGCEEIKVCIHKIVIEMSYQNLSYFEESPNYL